MDIESLSPKQLRELCRSGAYTGPTTGLAKGHVQTNLMIVPREDAFDFLLFCQRNPKACPLVEVLEPGGVKPHCTEGGDVRTDFPGYRVFENGVLVQEAEDVTALWRDDLVSFLIGCSFSFEHALIEAGIALRHVDERSNVAMYKTDIACRPAGKFRGDMVVSMRPIKSSDIVRVVEICSRFPHAHGAPIHIGHPQAIGIRDLAAPDFGDPVAILEDELPVFWLCGVTPQYVAQLSRIPFCISHAPGKMLVTDMTEL